MAMFVNQERFLALLKEYQFRAYDRPKPKRGMTPRCQDQINSSMASRESLLKEKLVPYEDRPLKGFKKERRTDETLDELVQCMDNYIEFKKKCLENHLKCHSSLKHQMKTDGELIAIEKELGEIGKTMASECFRAWFAGYTNYYRSELIAMGTSAFWEKLTHFNTEFKFPFSYYTTVIKRAMIGFISEFHQYKKTTMSLSIFTDIDSA